MIQRLPFSSVLLGSGVLLLILPSGWWYLQRMTDGSDEPYGVIALISWLFFLPWMRWVADFRSGTLLSRKEAVIALILGGAVAFIPGIPALVRAGLLVGAISLLALKKGMPPGATILGLISLPILASLDFYIGYPLRWVCGWLGTEGLQFFGLPVVLEGITMSIEGKEIVIDRPCAGLQYLWFGWLVSGCVTSFQRMGRKMVLVGSLATGCLLFLSNVVRVVTLFLLEWKGWGGPIAHETAGLVIFAVALVMIVGVLRRLDRRDQGVLGRTQTRPHSRIVRAERAGFGLAFAVFGFGLLSSGVWATRFVVKAEALATGADASTEWSASSDGRYLLLESFEEGGIPVRLYQDDEALLLVRHVEKPTRRLHPADDCFRGAGWGIENGTLWKDPYERNWRRFYATKDGNELEIRQRIEGADGWSGTDVSQWYWNAVLGKTKGPWKAWVVVRERAASRERKLDPHESL
ncbi:MAG: exosortase/archaeosortase family protein [Verrucomicrobiota bacterium]